MSPPSPPRSGAQGWRQFLTARKSMLDAYDRARTQARAHQVETHHGRVAEAEFRRWLESFLPGRYGVCAGFIVSQGAGEDEKLPHYDVIVYDRLNAPVLWWEGTPDASQADTSACDTGRARASRRRGQGSADIIVSRGSGRASRRPRVAPRSRRRGGYPPPRVPTRSVRLTYGLLRGSRGGPVQRRCANESRSRGVPARLRWRRRSRAEGRTDDASGRLTMVFCEAAQAGSLGQGGESSLRTGCAGDSKPVRGAPPSSPGEHAFALLTWAEADFPMFAFDLLSRLDGTYDPGGRISSFHALPFTKLGR